MGSQLENVSLLVPTPGGRCACARWGDRNEAGDSALLGGEDRMTVAVRGDALFGLILCRIPISLYFVL